MSTQSNPAIHPHTPTPATAMNQSADPRILRTLAMEGVSLALWDRRLSENLTRILDALPAAQLPTMRQSLNVNHVSAGVHATCIASGAHACADELARDIADIAQHASDVFATRLLEIRLDATQGQPCPKWHLDAVPARLLCSLRGPGTEFGPIGPGDTPQSIHRMARGAVGVFRGALWPARQPAGILHRSPPGNEGNTRLLLVIDPIRDDRSN